MCRLSPAVPTSQHKSYNDWWFWCKSGILYSTLLVWTWILWPRAERDDQEHTWADAVCLQQRVLLFVKIVLTCAYPGCWMPLLLLPPSLSVFGSQFSVTETLMLWALDVGTAGEGLHTLTLRCKTNSIINGWECAHVYVIIQWRKFALQTVVNALRTGNHKPAVYESPRTTVSPKNPFYCSTEEY